VRRVGPDGIIATVAGGDRMGLSGDGGPATAAALHEPAGLAVGPDGALYIADTFNERIRVVTPVAQGFSTSDMLVAADDGSEVYVLRDGRHLRTLDALTGGLRYQFAYDAAGRLASVTDGDGNLTRIERDATGTPTAVIAPGGQRTGLAINASGYLTAITDPAGAAMSMEYGAGGLLARLVDARGGVHRYSYDADGRLIRDDQPDGGATSLARVEATNAYTVTATDALNRATRYVVERLADGGARRVRIDPAGARSELILATDGGVEMVYPDGTRMSLRYAPDPRWGMQAPLLASAVVTTPGGLVSTRGVSRTVALSDTRDILSLTALTDTLVLNGRVYTTTYDSRTRALAGVTPEGARSVSLLDATGRVTQTTEAPGLLPSLTVYDARGRLSQVSQGGVGWTIGYDAGNRQVSRTDTAGNVTRFGHDAAGRIISTTLPGAGGRVYLSAYDGAGNRTQLRMPSNALHQLGYAPDGQWASYTPPGGQPYSATLNLAGQSARVTLPSGRAVNKTYDAGGRLAGVSYPEAAYVFEYADATDQPTLLRRSPADGAPAQSLAMRYDGDLAIEQIFAGPAAGSFAYRYDADHALISTTLDGAAPVLLAYDRDGRLAGNGPFTLARGGPGGRTIRIQGAGLDAGLGYDTIGRLVTRTVSVAGQAVYAAQVERDLMGRIARKAESVAGSARVYTYTHDANNQLLQVWRDGALFESYVYDANGNRSSRQVPGASVETATYDAQDRLMQRGSLAYAFDADGYLTGRGGDTFTYSARGELLRAVIGGQAITYGYDAWGRRVSRTDSAGARQYLYGRPDNLLQLTASRDSGGALTQYSYDDTGRLFALQRGGAWYFVAADAAGTPRAVANAAGAVVKTLDYDAFGNLLVDSNPAFELAIGFNGGLADPATGLTRFGWRDYDPAAGRWAARDPLLFEGEAANLYAYVGNNPVNLVDPTGLLGIELSGGEGIGGGVKGSITSEGTSFCVEVGFVVGGGLEVDPTGDLDPPTVYAKAELAGKLGPISGQIGAKADECMNDEVKAKVCSGPMCAEADLLTGKMGSTMSPPEKGWTKMRGAKIEGKAVVGKCWRFKW
jgi:RHS repeat-associated protein